MTIQLYKITSDNIYIDKLKGLRPFLELDGNLRDDTSILNPIITVLAEFTYTDVNYMYIPEFKRYYYITDIVRGTDKTQILYCHVDVLMSHKKSILNTYAQVDRYENSDNYVLPNDNIIVTTTDMLESVHVYPTYIFDPYTINDKTYKPASYILSGLGVQT